MRDILNDGAGDPMDAVYERMAAEARELFGDRTFDRRRKSVLMGRMDHPTCSGIVTGTCGETMEFHLRIENECIEDIRFFSDGCESSLLCGSVAAELAKGRNIDDAALIGGDTILVILKELPPEENHCAFLAAEALHAAIHNWMLQ